MGVQVVSLERIHDRRKEFRGGYLVVHREGMQWGHVYKVGRITALGLNDDLMWILTDTGAYYRTPIERDYAKPTISEDDLCGHMFIHDPLLNTCYTLVPIQQQVRDDGTSDDPS